MSQDAHKSYMTKRIRRHIRLHLENFNISGALGSAVLRFIGLYRRGIHNAMDLQVNEFIIHLENLPSAFDGFRIMLMADLHIDGKIDLVNKICDRASQINADICCFLGDYRAKVMGDYHKTIDKMAQVVEKVTISECYGIRGNHDSLPLIRLLSELGITMLINQTVSLERDGQCIYLLGVDDPHFYETDDLELVLNGIPEHSFKILLVHSPEIHWKAAKAGIDLYLCGHTHGGQICSKRYGPIIVNAHDSHLQARGFWRYEGMKGFTSTGIGTSAMPVRFNCPPEIAVLTLKKEKNA
jgi:predicted MPP superfamily phosphohydrolase